MLWNYAATIMRVLSGIIILPITLRLLPPEEMGLWAIFLSLTTITSLLDFGFASSFARNVTYVFSGVKELKANGYGEVEEGHADIVVADIIKEYPDGKVQIECYEHSDDIETCRLNVLIAVKSPNYLCGKLIAKRLFDNELFVPVPDGQNYWEDRFVLTQLYFFTDKIAKVDKPLYHYIQYNSSAISAQSRRRMHFENAFTFWTFLEDFLSKRQVYDKYKDVIDFEKVKHKASMMISTSSNALRKEFADKYYQEETKYYSQLKKGKKIITFLNRHKLFVLSQAYHYGVCFVKSIKK